MPIYVDETNEILRKLIWCDLLYEHGDQFYGGLSDPVLAQVLNIQYSWEIYAGEGHVVYRRAYTDPDAA